MESATYLNIFGSDIGAMTNWDFVSDMKGFGSSSWNTERFGWRWRSRFSWSKTGWHIPHFLHHLQFLRVLFITKLFAVQKKELRNQKKWRWFQRAEMNTEKSAERERTREDKKAVHSWIGYNWIFCPLQVTVSQTSRCASKKKLFPLADHCFLNFFNWHPRISLFLI